MINLEKRKRIMQRSIKLGHCICNPRQPCPCDLFQQKNVCHCAGERLEESVASVRLTQLTEKPGCASKIDQAFLKRVLGGLPAIEDSRVLVGAAAGDDAGIFDLGDGRALVQTVDVFTPLVDDPYVFGQIAAANSLSDIYAMGGEPLTALSIIGFPVGKIPDSALNDLLRGGIDKMNEARTPVIGGHSINDLDVKAGFAVTGIIDTDKIITNAAARPGDTLILTKPLGTGIVAFAHQIGRAASGNVDAAIRSMTALNASAAHAMRRFSTHACTDVTGFSLMGHLTEMSLRSGVDAELVWDDLPLLPGVLEYVAAGILPGAIERNRESCGDRVTWDDDFRRESADICFDAQTSGGLLIAVAQAQADPLIEALHGEGIADAAVIGRIVGPGSGRVHIITNGKRR